MSKRSTREKVRNLHTNNGWGKVVSDCEAEIMKAQERIQQLRTSIAIASEKIRLGEPFPTESTQI